MSPSNSDADSDPDDGADGGADSEPNGEAKDQAEHRATGGPEPEPRSSGSGELEELRRRIAQLESRGAAPHREHHRLRATGSAVLIVLAAVLSLLAVVSVWARDQVTDTDRFVAAMAPLAHDPHVQDALTTACARRAT
jgi:hypothetical protein